MADHYVVNVETGDAGFVKLQPDEHRQFKAAQKTLADEAAAQEEARAEQNKLVKKLAAGKASDGEVQAALAQLLGG